MNLQTSVCSATTTKTSYPILSAAYFSVFNYFKDKAAGAVVDAISTSQLTIRKEKEDLEKKETDRQARIHSSRNSGMQNCKPSSMATKYPKPSFRAGRGGGTRASGGDSSRTVKPLDAAIIKAVTEGGGGGDLFMDHEDFKAASNATDRDMRLFFEDGWAGDDISWGVAHPLMTFAMHMFTGTIPGGKAAWDEEDGLWKDQEFPGMHEDVVAVLCKHFGADVNDLKQQTTSSAFKLYTSGWIGDQLSCGTVLFLHETLAEMLLAGETYECPVDSEDDSGDDRRPHKRVREGKSKSGRKTREPKNAAKEAGLDG